jgi:hypothetical protein
MSFLIPFFANLFLSRLLSFHMHLLNTSRDSMFIDPHLSKASGFFSTKDSQVDVCNRKREYWLGRRQTVFVGIFLTICISRIFPAFITTSAESF